jgi:hypothetical protein
MFKLSGIFLRLPFPNFHFIFQPKSLPREWNTDEREILKAILKETNLFKDETGSVKNHFKNY